MKFIDVAHHGVKVTNEKVCVCPIDPAHPPQRSTFFPAAHLFAPTVFKGRRHVCNMAPSSWPSTGDGIRKISCCHLKGLVTVLVIWTLCLEKPTSLRVISFRPALEGSGVSCCFDCPFKDDVATGRHQAGRCRTLTRLLAQHRIATIAQTNADWRRPVARRGRRP